MSNLLQMHRLIQQWLNRLHVSVLRSFEFSEPQIVPMGTIGVVYFPLFYLIWHYVFPEPYENLELRLVGSGLCLLLVLRDYWPKRMQGLFPICWYITVLYVLPFFFSFWVLKNNWSVISTMSLLIAIFILVLLVDWLSLSILFISGMVLAFAVDYLTSPAGLKPVIYLNYLVVYLFALIIGMVFNYKTAILKREKMAAMSLISSSIAHELRTPLLGIKSGSLGMKRYLPILFDAYSLARDHGLPVMKIRAAHYNTLLPALERIENETNNANTMIDMLLMNVGKQAIDPSVFETCSMADCIEEGLRRFPFSSKGERNLVEWDKDAVDFYFHGAKLLIVHVLFNFIKNSLHFIAKAHKGKIRIWLAEGTRQNYFYFKDTGKGIPSDILPRIFERFFSTTIAGTGIGLSFCKFVIESIGGSISCHSMYGSYTEFVISLPKIDTALRRQ